MCKYDHILDKHYHYYTSLNDNVYKLFYNHMHYHWV